MLGYNNNSTTIMIIISGYMLLLLLRLLLLLLIIIIMMIMMIMIMLIKLIMHEFTNLLEVNAAVIEQCKAKTHSTTELDISYKKAPARDRCGATPEAPCSASYHRKYYYRLPRKAQPKTCKACAIKDSGYV